jgi:RNA polymerase sigma-70 factor (ECF subfamily)
MPEPEIVARWDLAAAGSARARTPSAEEEEVARLFDELRSHLLRYLLSAGLRTQDGEEIVQEVFLGLFQHLRQGRSRQNLRGWAFRVAHNLGLKRRMSGAREGLQNDFGDTWPDPAENPEEQMLTSQRQARLQAVLRALPRQDQCCLSLRAEGLRYREIAGVLGISLASVAASLERSLARFSRADGV